MALTLSYDGTHYAGFQIQKNKKTVQGVLEETLRKILKKKPRLLYAGRTDAGVHALSQIVSFKIDSSISTGALQKALNSLLPPDIVVQKAKVVPSSFHPRYERAFKHYRYTLRYHPSRSPFDRLYTTFYPYVLDLSAMRQAARYLKGRHDFKSFQASDKKERSSVRVLHRLSLRRKPPYLFIDLIGNGFLYKMVRNIVGTLLEVGRGRRTPETIKRLLSKKDRCLAGPTAPAKGLFLVSVRYPSEKGR